MSLPFTSVVGYHIEPMTCGVAKFNAHLARRLSIPCVDLRGPWGAYPLLSLKWSELGSDGFWALRERLIDPSIRYALFWHDAGYHELTERAGIVYHADSALGVNGLWCPSLLPVVSRPLRLFSFGMAHKLQPQYYARMRDLLHGHEYHLRVSVGLHEGTSLSEATQYFEALKSILGPDRVTILGILSDEAVALELRDADYVLAFFETAVRANNTTVHAALEAGATVITNHDAKTPPFLCTATRDIHTLTTLDTAVPYYYSWDQLIDDMAAIYARTHDQLQAHQR